MNINTTRRQFLNGISLGSGGLLLNPIVRQIQAEAAGVAETPPRFVFVVEGNGLPPNQVCPEEIKFQNRQHRKQFEEFDLAGKTLPTSLGPIAKYQDKVTIIQGLSGKIAGGGHSNDFGALGAYAAKGGVGNSGSPRGETIDYALGMANPGIFPLINLGISDRPEHSVIYNCSASGAGKALPTQCNPQLAYNAIFGAVAEGEGKRQFQANQDLLGFMAGDIRRVEKQIGGADREKLQSYLEAFEGLRGRQERLVEVRDTLEKVAPVPDDKFASDVESDRLDAQFELATASLIGRLTNSVTVASGAGNPYFSVRWNGLGIEIGKHSIGHGSGFDGMSAAELMVKIRRFHFGLIARMMDKLAAVPEGDGTMLDNTLIVYLSDAAEGHHSRCWEWPFVLIGDLGGKLKCGRYLSYPDYGLPGHRTFNSLYNSLLHAAGAPRDDFGMADGMLKDLDQSGPLAELMA